MQNGLERFGGVIETIEASLDGEIDVAALALQMNLSVYEFRRIFSFLAGMPLGEYIRKRRLSAAAQELLSGKSSVTELALKYGYELPSSFSRAFREHHGVSPEELQGGAGQPKMLTKLCLSVGVSGGENIAYALIDDGAFYLKGFSGSSDLRDSECCEEVWEAFYRSDSLAEITEKCGGKIYASYKNAENNTVECTIGARNPLDGILIPASKWAVFSLRGTDDAMVNAFYNNVLFHWFHSSMFERNEACPNLEVFPEEMDDDDFVWEIRIPIRERRKRHE